MSSPRQVLSNLRHLDAVDTATSARYRRQAQQILANPQISLKMRTAIADRLHQANNLLALQTVSGDSY
ncbi:hypothetical protein C7271_24165 [filamentous cyanobacterium CCP5]|nr:hypothetical protein C7271_24165 [filamentous cyanobacterium CCP5]